jgi:hypothetical protein
VNNLLNVLEVLILRIHDENKDQDKIENLICWRKEWVHQFESPLSVIEKVKMANRVSSMTFYKSFVDSKQRNRKAPKIFPNKMNLYTLKGFDKTELMKILNYDVRII